MFGKWIRACTRAAIGIFATIGLTLVLVTFSPVTSIYAKWLAGPWTDPEGPVLVVLGGASMEEGIIGENTYWRAVYALRAYRKSHFPLVILTGAQAVHDMRDFLTFQGVPAEAIKLEPRATTTRENALYVRQMLANVSGPKILMTSDYHMLCSGPSGYLPAPESRSSPVPFRMPSSRAQAGMAAGRLSWMRL